MTAADTTPRFPWAQGIDHELKRACEEVIASCADAVCRPIRAWLERVAQFRGDAAAGGAGAKDGGVGTAAEPLAAQPWASRPAAAALVVAFNEACHRDLRSAVARLKLYLEDERTVNVLVKHAQERIVDEYAEFRALVWGTYGEQMKGEVLSEDALRALLLVVCGEDEPHAGSQAEAGRSDAP